MDQSCTPWYVIWWPGEQRRADYRNITQTGRQTVKETTTQATATTTARANDVCAPATASAAETPAAPCKDDKGRVGTTRATTATNITTATTERERGGDRVGGGDARGTASQRPVPGGCVKSHCGDNPFVRKRVARETAPAVAATLVAPCKHRRCTTGTTEWTLGESATGPGVFECQFLVTWPEELVMWAMSVNPADDVVAY
ncbi:hypothetical protein BU14_0183s0010 [Porphyra umbilicalis]|uniref:Uncharacterized protein n=1 Tax=Porphyra umbilicalis TaxID=2786 RepID=A0A1X6P716_PORUM|nr:hypothetical protein BU14_0183s0010 [Porphyra umbilicalis]|eukprot:OSX76617.1 hypothetical protein BU14_0183s0010 [Porphyra umbilicalis]